MEHLAQALLRTGAAAGGGDDPAAVALAIDLLPRLAEASFSAPDSLRGATAIEVRTDFP